MNITLQQILALDAVIKQGSIQAGASYLNKTHPTIISTLRNLEDQLGFALFDRSGYRTELTTEGKQFYASSQRMIDDLDTLKKQAKHLSEGEEAELNIVIGDLTPIDRSLKILRTFSLENPHTRLNLFFENLYGPNEKLLEENADIIIHHIDKTNPAFEFIPFCQVEVIPVCAPKFFNSPITSSTNYNDINVYTQCIIRDSALKIRYTKPFC